MHNSQFIARIENTLVMGVVFVSKRTKDVYLLQDKKEGRRPDEDFDNKGYRYSWKVGQFSKENLEDMSVSDFQLIDSSMIKPGFVTKHHNKEVTVIAFDGEFGYVSDNFEDPIAILPTAIIFINKAA